MIYTKIRKMSNQEGEVLMSYKIYGTLGFAIGGFIVGLAGDYMLFALIFMGFNWKCFSDDSSSQSKINHSYCGTWKYRLSRWFLGAIFYYHGHF